MNIEKQKRIEEMIKEYKDIEKHIQKHIIQLQTRLDKHRQRCGILQDVLEAEMERGLEGLNTGK